MVCSKEGFMSSGTQQVLVGHYRGGDAVLEEVNKDGKVLEPPIHVPTIKD